VFGGVVFLSVGKYLEQHRRGVTRARAFGGGGALQKIEKVTRAKKKKRLPFCARTKQKKTRAAKAYLTSEKDRRR